MAAKGLKWNRKKWENPGSNPIEYVQFENLSRSHDTPAGRYQKIFNAKKKLEYLNLNNPVCWNHKVNHYRGFSWSQIRSAQTPDGKSVLKLAKALGWNRKNWLRYIDSFPNFLCTSWIELSKKQKKAALGLGYSLLTWGDPRCDPTSNI